MGNLKPCPAPWCNEAEDLNLTGYNLDRFVVCGACGCSSPSAKTDDAAIAAWNTRPPIDLPPDAMALCSPDLPCERYNKLEAEVARLREALADLLSWFPEETPKPEYRITAGEWGADDAIAFARAAIKEANDEAG